MAVAQQPFPWSGYSVEPLLWGAGPLCCHLVTQLAKVSQSSAKEMANGGDEGLGLNIKAHFTTGYPLLWRAQHVLMLTTLGKPCTHMTV